MWNTIIPEQASTYAQKVDPLFWALTIFLGLFFVGVLTVMVALGIIYRQRPGEKRRSQHVDNLRIEITIACVLVLLSLGIFAWGSVLYFDYAAAPADALDINVVAKRWMWKIQHANGKREVNELHIPVGKPIKLTMTSQDVIHNFYVPAFRVKQDVLPARYTTLWFQPTKVGSYPLFCAEYCGTQHSTMGGTVHVMKPADYEDWLRGGGADLTPVQAGEALFSRMGCASCHAAGDMSRGPSLNGLYGTEVKLRDGTTATADDEYLRESIMNPTAKVVEGYTPLMPMFSAQLSEEDVLNLIAYLKTLSAQAQ